MTGDLGAVVIGRNEGDRLRRGLASVEPGVPVVYVDSGSTDGSPAAARAAGAEVVELDLSVPFTAARARQAGFERLLDWRPGVAFVQFVDGDCELSPGWLARARAEFDARPRAAVVFGLLRERWPERSVYNRVADVEWNVPMGRAVAAGGALEVDACGGIALVRTEAYRQVGGFDPTVPVCEEPELCQRLRRAGWAVVRVDAPMALHDAALLRFRQWARRACRTGYGGLDFSTRFGREGDDTFRRQVRSARVWGLGWPAALAAGTGLAAAAGGPAAAAITAAAITAVLPAQAARVAWKNRERAGGAGAALAYGALTVASKWPQLYGQALYLRDRRAGRAATLIEHKGAPVVDAGRAPANLGGARDTV